MELWDNNFYNLRNDYIIPLVSYQGNYSKSVYNNLKATLSSGFNNIVNLSGKTFEIEIDSDRFYKCLINDIELFYTRTIIQYVDVENSRLSSNSWRFVTQYYFSFFSVTTLFRILKFGFTFFSKQEVDSFNILATSILKSKVQITTGNYSFKYLRLETNGNVIVELSEVGEGIHNKTWHKASDLINTFYTKSDNDEKTILSILKQMAKEYKGDFPSEMRNTINYHGQFGMDSINNRFIFSDTILPVEKYIKKILAYKKSEELNNKAEDVGLFGYYFFLMTHELLKDYHSRVWVKNDFQKARAIFLRKRGVTIF